MTSLGILDLGSFSHAAAISGDGLVVVGYGDRDGEGRGLRWINGAINTVHAVDVLRPLSVNADGSVLGG